MKLPVPPGAAGPGAVWFPALSNVTTLDDMGEQVQGTGPARGRETATCDFCGRSAPPDEVATTWSTALENGRTRRFCADCTRSHLRSAEARLDSEWW